MTKFLSSLTALALVASLATGAAEAKDKHHGTKGASTKASAMGQRMSTQCAPGKSWVKAYTKKNGKKVKGYCR